MKFNNRNVTISSSVKIGQNVRIGDNTIIYDNVEVSDNTVICNDCIIGEPLQDYYYKDDYKNPRTVIGSNSLIRSHTIIYAGNEIGDNFMCGHRVTIREFTKFGKNNMIGTLGDIQGFAELGDYCRMQCNVHIGQGTKLGNFVFVFPFTVFTNDPHPPSQICEGATIGDFTQVAVHCTILSGISIGRNCLVGANSTVNTDFGEEVIIIGNPAKAIGKTTKIKSKEKGKENQSHYPWMYNFDRNMPWEGQDFKKWALSQQEYEIIL